MAEAIGFVGLGNMGVPMAQNLMKAGYDLHVFNRTAPRAEGLLSQGATWAESPRALAERTELVVSMVADDEALEAVSLGEQGILAGLNPDGVHVDMSTVFPDTSRDLAQRYQERGVHFIAAPVSGRPDFAEARQLVFYPAGPPKILERCRPIFEALGRSVIVVGEEPQLANVMKLVTNFFLFSLIESLSEAFTLAEKSGLDPQHLLDMIRDRYPSPVIQGYAGRIAQQHYSEPGATLELASKDVRHIRRLADQVGAPLPLADVVHRHCLAALAQGRNQLDVAALSTVLREAAGLRSG